MVLWCGAGKRHSASLVAFKKAPVFPVYPPFPWSQDKFDVPDGSVANYQ